MFHFTQRLGLVLFLLLVHFAAMAQEPYWVFLKDKEGVQFDPYRYFDQKAIDRRIKNNIPLSEETDWPLNENYSQQINALSDSVLGETRWFNAIAILATPSQLAEISKLNFVSKIKPIYLQTILAKNESTQASVDENTLITNQLEVMGFSEFQKKGIDGKGVRIAIFDGGFPGVNTIDAFKKIRDEDRLLKTWDFTKNKENVFYSIQHGTNVMSNVGGIDRYSEQNIGMASGAEFLLAKTEINREPFSEEKNWLQAVEWADKNGADIINSSLGYTTSRYFQEDMDGEKSLAARAANLAARKGILVINAAGNDGSSSWEVIGTPADADSVLSVGGVDPSSLLHINFSSYGPTASGKMKPNVCAFGTSMVANKKNSLNSADGTSFSSPLVTGFAACALQVHPELKAMELFELIEKSGHLYPYFDYAHGYGIPQASYILNQTKDSVPMAFDLVKNNNLIEAIIHSPDSFQIGQSAYLYLKIADSHHHIIDYKVIKVTQNLINIDAILNLDEIFFSDDETYFVEAYYLGTIRRISLYN